jgi:hypothetical protein
MRLAALAAIALLVAGCAAESRADQCRANGGTAQLEPADVNSTSCGQPRCTTYDLEWVCRDANGTIIDEWPKE